MLPWWWTGQAFEDLVLLLTLSPHKRECFVFLFPGNSCLWLWQNLLDFFSPNWVIWVIILVVSESNTRSGLPCRPLTDVRPWQSDVFLRLSKIRINSLSQRGLVSWISSFGYLFGRSLAFSAFPEDVASRYDTEGTESPMLFKPWVTSALEANPLSLWRLLYSPNQEIISESNILVISLWVPPPPSEQASRPPIKLSARDTLKRASYQSSPG